MVDETEMAVLPPFVVTRARIDAIADLGGAVRVDLELGGCCGTNRSLGQPRPGPGQPSRQSCRPMPWDDDYEPPAHWTRQTGWTPGS